jgi:Protein of unknown function (DUF3575)
MMKTSVSIIALVCGMISSTTTFAQTNIPSPHHLIIKTNLLNIIFAPSVHIEYQLKRNLSVQAHYHRFRYVFFGTEDILNTNVELRYYLPTKTTGHLTGMYVSGGIGVHTDYNETRLLGSTLFYHIEETSLMLPVIRFGNQIRSKNTHWYADFGGGLAYYILPFQRNDRYSVTPDFRATVAVGCRIM